MLDRTRPILINTTISTDHPHHFRLQTTPHPTPAPSKQPPTLEDPRLVLRLEGRAEQINITLRSLPSRCLACFLTGVGGGWCLVSPRKTDELKPLSDLVTSYTWYSSNKSWRKTFRATLLSYFCHVFLADLFKEATGMKCQWSRESIIKVLANIYWFWECLSKGLLRCNCTLDSHCQYLIF